MDNVPGSTGNDDLTATKAGARVSGGAGNDTLRGGKGDDILIGGPGDDMLRGGGGADQFRFFGNAVEGANDTDRLFDLNFGEGDQLVFGSYNGLFSQDDDGVNGFANGDSAIISSYEGLFNAVQNAGARASFVGDAASDLLFVTFDTGNGSSQTLRISNGFAAFLAAGNPPA